MALTKRTYVDGETVITAENLNDIQDAIIENAEDIATQGEDIGDLKVEKANIDGTYPYLTAGNAMQLDSNLYAEDQEPYLFRQTGGSVKAGNREEDCIIGATVAWNQLVENGNFSNGVNSWGKIRGTLSASNNIGTFVSGAGSDNSVIKDTEYQANHRYLVSFEYKSNKPFYHQPIVKNNGTVLLSATDSFAKNSMIASRSSYSVTYSRAYWYNYDSLTEGEWELNIKNYVVHDLTSMFGSAIADHVYALEQATAGSGIAWLKSMGFFTKDYYAYDAGSLQSVKVGSHKTTGKNLVFKRVPSCTINTSGMLQATSANSEMQVAKVIAGKEYTITSDELFVGAFFYSEPDVGSVSYTGSRLADTPKTFTAPITGYVAFRTSGNYATPQMEFGSTATAYESYESHTYLLDTTKEWRGILKLDANNKVYADGDIYPPSGEATRKYGIVNLGTLDWSYSSTGLYFFSAILNNALPVQPYGRPFVCSKYVRSTAEYASGMANKTMLICTASSNDPRAFIHDEDYTDSTVFKTAMSGVYLVYELATPTSESALPYQTPQICAADGTEEYTDYAVAAGTRDVAVPVGHDTKYPPDQVKKLDNLPSDLSFVGPIENGATCQNANGYLQGQYFVKNNQFCKAKTAIASGATFTLNTNYEVTTIAAELYAALNS